jgi:hypothetical protein
VKRRCGCPHANDEHQNVGTQTTPTVRCQVPGCGCEFGPARRFAKLYLTAAQASEAEPTLFERFADGGAR